MKDTNRWSRLDNAAKIFPPTTTRRDTKVFRYVCELREPVSPDLLQRAAEQAVEEFSLYRCVLKKGLFWYYFEQTEQTVKVREERYPPCGPMYSPDRPRLLFRVSWFGARINLEVFHALADGTGAMHFLRCLVWHYLALAHPDEVPADGLGDYDASRDQRQQDAFYKYFDRGAKTPAPKAAAAYRIRGDRLPDARLGVMEALLSTREALALAHEHEATLSELLTALLLLAVYDNMAVRERKRPVIVTVPVDLRRLFPAQTARNFFGLIRVGYDFSKGEASLEAVLAEVRRSYAEQQGRENLLGFINRYSAIENNPVIKAVPLFLKIPVLRLAGLWAEREDTVAFSNVGRIGMPEAAARHIRLFDVFLSTKRPQLCVCSFGDRLALSISSPLRSTDLQRSFFRRLTGLGLAVELASNLDEEVDVHA